MTGKKAKYQRKQLRKAGFQVTQKRDEHRQPTTIIGRWSLDRREPKAVR